MNTCVNFEVADTPVRRAEEVTGEDYKSDLDFGLTLLTSIAQSLAERGLKVRKV